ncbi:hypothetical protein EV193_11845 [Herbihabitans rhizosphaerae]|uniref:Neocarzinostatin family protein n=1 Tax=Herbihabitans rhizosphaerae TaxID=1872711 RepID=A0A4V2ERA7_9PSEU|nr:hypothetical protein [Herbihabitans rhizosphaerae]RZS29791.1 hypothetical protein EV193_11845 [Herbihabitans rhizosphaerae]
MRTTTKSLVSALFAALLTIGLFAASAQATSRPDTRAPEITVTSGKLVKGGAAVKLTGTYQCNGATFDLLADVDQAGHAKGKAKVKGLSCDKGATGKKKFTVTVAADTHRGLFISAGAWIYIGLCHPGTLTVWASVNLSVHLRP